MEARLGDIIAVMQGGKLEVGRIVEHEGLLHGDFSGCKRSLRSLDVDKINGKLYYFVSAKTRLAQRTAAKMIELTGASSIASSLAARLLNMKDEDLIRLSLLLTDP